MNAITELKRITILEHLPGPKLAITWDDQPRMVIDFTSLIRSRADLAPLADESLFKKARIGERRRVVEWPTPADEDGEPLLDIDAETLFDIASHQSHHDLLHRILGYITKARRH
jgi:hypothetical protein